MPVPVPAASAFGMAGGDWLVLARVYKEDATTHNLGFAAQGDVSSVVRYLVDLTDGAGLLYTDTLTVSTTILATPSMGNIFTLDNVGFNLRDVIPGAKLTDMVGVEAQYVVTLTGGPVAKFCVQLNLKTSN